MNNAYLWCAMALVVMGAVHAQANASTFSINRYAPFNETIICTTVNDTYVIQAFVNVTNITFANQTFEAVCSGRPQLGVDYEIEFASSSSPNKTQVNAFFIHDYTGATVQQRDWSFLPVETSEIRFKLPFTCPVDLTPQINFKTCSAFFQDFITTEEPLLFTLASGTIQCQDELSNTTAEFLSAKEILGQCQVQKAEEISKNTILSQDFEKCQDELTEPAGSCFQRILLEKNATARLEANIRNELVPSYWMWIAIVFIVVAGISFIRTLTWSG